MINTWASLGDAPLFLGLALAETHLGGLGKYLGNRYRITLDDLMVMEEHILGSESGINAFLRALGLPENDGPSWWITDVLPAVRTEIARRQRPKAVATSNNPWSRVKALDLVEVASRYTTMAPAGPGKFKAKCPLHLEKSPSFYVYTASQRWRCFGACAAGGDVIDLLGLMGDLDRELRKQGLRSRKAHNFIRADNWEVTV